MNKRDKIAKKCANILEEVLRDGYLDLANYGFVAIEKTPSGGIHLEPTLNLKPLYNPMGPQKRMLNDRK